MHQGACRDRQPRGRATGRARICGRHSAGSRLGPRAAASHGRGRGDIRIIIRQIAEVADVDVGPNGTSDSARIAAAASILDRRLGRPGRAEIATSQSIQ